jgi:hypothetical protein
MKRIAPLAGLVVATLLGGCAVYPDGTPMYGNGYGGYNGYDGSAYAPGAAVVPQTNVYLGYSDYGPGRYYGPGPGPGYHGYPDRGHPSDNDWHHGDHGDHGDRGNNGGGPGQPHGGPPPQGAAGGPHGPGGANGGPRPGAGGPPPAQPQPGNGGGRGNAWVKSAPARQPGQMTEH